MRPLTPGITCYKTLLRAIRRYGMINPDDHIAVGLSGGKDSITLLFLLAGLQRYSHLKFRLSAIHIEAFGNHNIEVLQNFCAELGTDLFIGRLERQGPVPTKSVCSLCARLKRGAMMQICRENGINVVALGHHASDAAETLLMNMLINKKLGSFCPAVAIESSAVRLIRPMIYLEEATVSRLHQRFDLPCAENSCPYEDKNQRILFKQTIDLIKKTTKIKTPALNMVKALENPDDENSYPALLKDD